MIDLQARILPQIIKEIAEEKGIEYQAYSYDWIIELKKGERSCKIYGYQFDLNATAASEIARDKSGISELLINNDIPCIEHKLFLNPGFTDYVNDVGNWSKALAYAKKYDYQLVCKGNQGSSGNKVYKIQTARDLEIAFQNIFTKERGVALSPYYAIDKEYRLVMLNSECLLCYSKERPFVIGDGRQTFEDLVKNSLGEEDQKLLLSVLKDPIIDLATVPEAGAKVNMSWKHNLSKGAKPKTIEDAELKAKLYDLAEKARQVSGLNFASVDIVETEQGMQILELNSGVMLENFARIHYDGYQQAKRVYSLALESIFS